MIEFENFSAYHKHKKIQALDCLNFHIHRGELLVVVGQSGSGKSTLLKSILGSAPAISSKNPAFGIRTRSRIGMKTTASWIWAFKENEYDRI